MQPLNLGRPPGFWAGGLGYLPSKGKRQAAQGAEHAKMKAQKAKMKGNEGVQSQKIEN